MRGLFAFILVCCLCATAYGVQSETGNVLDASGKGRSLGDGAMGDPRVGGDTCPNATPISSLPYTDNGATCGFANNYDSACPYSGSTSADVVYRYVPTASTQITVDLCASAYDTKVYIYASTCSGSPIACNDDAGCGYSGYQSMLSNVSVTAGVPYYIVVDGYGGSCGQYSLTVTAVQPCVVTCPPGALQEGEPLCYDEYVDSYNGGCNSSPNVFQTVYAQAGDCFELCGKSGTFLVGGSQSRDTDWFRVIGTGAQVTASCTAEFPLQLILIYGTNCSALQYVITTANPCVPASLSYPIAQNAEAWIWVGASVFTGVPCNSDYLLRVCGVQGPGACCLGDGSCTIMTSGACAAAGGYFMGSGVSCVPDPCPHECGECGPGPHWVDTCPGGPDGMPSGAVVGIDTNLDCVRDLNAVMFGPVSVQRSGPLDDSGNYPGTRPIDGHTDVIDTEIISMTLTGGGLTLVGGFGQGAQPLAHSYGVIAEQPGDPSLADSFFDVFFEVDLGGGNRVYNQTPMRIDNNGIICVPPGSMYEHFQGCIPLYTSPVPGQGVHTVNLVTANHEPFPGRGACCFQTGGCQILVSSDCIGAGGVYMGDDTTCDPDPCVPQVGACCFGDGSCALMDAAQCSNAGGLYMGNGVPCNPNPCPSECGECGPGPHWVDTCGGGSDIMPSGAVVGIDTNLDCVRDMNAVMFGPVSVQRSGPLDDSNRYPGTRPIDGHTDVIDTEILSMSLTGSGLVLTAGFGQGAQPLAHSYGLIAELPGDPNLADSFFDVFFEVDLGGGNRVYNQTPLRINNNGIICVPPGSMYEHFQGCIPLYTSPVPGQGVQLVNLVTANHEPFPGRGACCFQTGGCQILISSDCIGAGGVYMGDDTTCDPDPCVPQVGACCFGDGSCALMDAAQCSNAGGLYMGNGTQCNPNPCPHECGECGPGPHWVDTCSGGPDSMPSGAVVGIDTNLDCVRDMNAVMFGPVSVQRSGPLDDSNRYPGTRPIDGHLDVIDTEILAMSLTGSGLVLTAGFGQGAQPLAHSYGLIAEQPGNPNLADSFFDVFFEVDLGGGNRVYNQTPLRINNNGIICVPPGSMYEHFQGCIPLYTSPVPGQGVHIVNLVTANHEPFPGRGACCFGTACQILVSSDCIGAGGLYMGDDTTCDPNPCVPQVGACCLGDGSCQIMDAAQCSNAGGLYMGNGTQCNPNPCPQPCGECGPGPHWVDSCSGGSDSMPSGAVVGIDTNLDCVRDMNAVMFGPVSVQRSGPLDDSGNYPGTRPIDGHLDVIDTEIVAMSLTGSGLVLTAGFGQGAQPLAHSYGLIAEQPGDPNLADSFFDVFFEVDLGGGNYVYNQTPLRISNAGIICVPPGSMYEHFQGCIPLYTSPVPGQGVHIVNLVTANHEPFPGRGACCFGTECVVVTSTECLGQDGDYRGDDTECTPGICLDVVPEQTPSGPPQLFENAPNPVVDRTAIRFYLPTGARATLEIYSANGAVIRTMTAEAAGAGTRALLWDRTDGHGRRVAAGVYHYVIRADSTMLTGKMTVIQ